VKVRWLNCHGDNINIDSDLPRQDYRYRHQSREHSTMRAYHSELRHIVWMQSVQVARRLGVALADKAAHWLERSRQRRALRGASDHLLKDIGISRAEAEYEAVKPFWRD
jgi:uncharacterized protein YjiS (DUF1127 family)